jgi:hypothetical protein
MESDSIARPDAPGFDALQILPHTIEDVLPEILHNMGI